MTLHINIYLMINPTCFSCILLNKAPRATSCSGCSRTAHLVNFASISLRFHCYIIADVINHCAEYSLLLNKVAVAK